MRNYSEKGGRGGRDEHAFGVTADPSLICTTRRAQRPQGKQVADSSGGSLKRKRDFRVLVSRDDGRIEVTDRDLRKGSRMKEEKSIQKGGKRGYRPYMSLVSR